MEENVRQNSIRRNPRGNLGGPNCERPYLDRIAVTRAEKWLKMLHYFPSFW